MFKLKLFIVLPVLVLVLPMTAIYFATKEIISETVDDVEAGVKHVSNYHFEGITNEILVEKSRATLAMAHEIGRGLAQTEQEKNDTVLHLRVLTGNTENKFAAVFDPNLSLVETDRESAEFINVCKESASVLSAQRGREKSNFVIIKNAAYIVSAAPIGTKPPPDPVLCFIRKVDNETAREFMDYSGNNVTLMNYGAFLGTSLWESFPDMVQSIVTNPQERFQGQLKGKSAPLLIDTPVLVSAEVQGGIKASNGVITVILSQPMAPAIKSLRKSQVIWLLFSFIILILVIVATFSIHYTITRSLGMSLETLNSATKGNLQAQVPIRRLSPPFKELGEAINGVIASFRERNALYHKRIETSGIFISEKPGESQVAPAVSKPPEAPSQKPEPSQPPTEILSNDFPALFKEFLEARKTCGEKTDNFTLESFSERLTKTHSNIVAKTSCKDVKFSIYVKDGKAAVKATPVK